MLLSRCDCFEYKILKIHLNASEYLLFSQICFVTSAPLFKSTWNNREVLSLLQAEIFQEFTLREDLVGFQVNLTVLLDCLNIFGGSAVPGKEKPCCNVSKRKIYLPTMMIFILIYSLISLY